MRDNIPSCKFTIWVRDSSINKLKEQHLVEHNDIEHLTARGKINFKVSI